MEIRAGTVWSVRPVQGGRYAGRQEREGGERRGGSLEDILMSAPTREIIGAVWVSDMWTRDPSVIGTTSYVTLDGFGGRLYMARPFFGGRVS